MTVGYTIQDTLQGCISLSPPLCHTWDYRFNGQFFTSGFPSSADTLPKFVLRYPTQSHLPSFPLYAPIGI